MRIIFMGNPQFSVPPLRWLSESHYDLLAVVSNPAKKIGRGKKLKETPVGQLARELNIPLLQPDDINDESFIKSIKEIKPDLFIIVAYRILPKSLIEIPTIGAVNLHGSLLPEYRGAAPIQWALINGDKFTGLTTFFIEPKVDTGVILNQIQIPIDPEDDFISLSTKMSWTGTKLLEKTCYELEKGIIEGIPQNHAKATQAPKIQKKDGLINWENSHFKIHNLVRGLNHSPGVYTIYKQKRIRIYKTKLIDDMVENRLPGEIVRRTKKELIVKTGDGCLSILDLQREGKKRMQISEFLQGSNINEGEKFSN